MTHTIILGSAFQVDAPVEGNVRNYKGANDTHWLGHDTHDVVYCCSVLCQDKVLEDAGVPWEEYVAAFRSEWVDMRMGRVTATNLGPSTMLYANTVEWANMPPSWPDYDVHCGHCEELLHEGTEDR